MHSIDIQHYIVNPILQEDGGREVGRKEKNLTSTARKRQQSEEQDGILQYSVALLKESSVCLLQRFATSK